LQAARLEGVKIIYIFDNMQPTPQIKALITFTALILCGLIRAQTPAPEQDCVGAIPVGYPYYNHTFEGYNGIGTGTDEVDSINTCLYKGEKNSVWFKVCIGANGKLTFNIIPSNFQDNYDWAVYNGTDYSCPYFNSNPDLLVSCNSESGTFPSNITGANDGSGVQDEPTIDVLQMETYYIVVNHQGLSGFTIDFVNTPLGAECITSDNENPKPQLVSVYPNPADNTITLSLPNLKQGQTADIAIYNTTGNLVKEVKNVDQSQTQIDIANLPNALYYYTLTTPNGIITDKFAKQ
jgi:hypothetical protein